MKKISVLIALCAVLFAGCKARLQNTDGKIKIACSNAPEYDWLLTVTGITNNNIVPTMIVKNGSGPHDFKPSETDLDLIKTYDLIILNGGKSDKWILEEIAKANNPKQRVLNFMELLELNPETDDEHVWLSVKNAKIMVQAICDEASLLLPSEKENFQTRTTKYLKRLETLHIEYKTWLSKYKDKTVIFCDRFPFHYLADNYELNCYSPFDVCTADSILTDEKETAVIEKIEELNAKALIVVDKAKERTAKSIIHKSINPMSDIFILDSMEDASLNQIFNGKTYMKVMEENLENLRNYFSK